MWTPQSLIDGWMTVTAYCDNPECRHRQLLDLEKLRDRLGPDVPAMADDLKPRLRCSKCNGKAISLIYNPDTARMNADRMAGGNRYAKAKGG